MKNEKTVKRFIAGFYSGQSWDICGHGKTLSAALSDLRARNLARAAKFEAEYCFKKFGFIDIRPDELQKTALSFGEQLEQGNFILQEITEHYYDVENQLSRIIAKRLPALIAL